MRIPIIKGTIKRRVLVNFRADPPVVQRFLPQPFRPKLNFSMESLDRAVSVRIVGQDADSLPARSCFGSLADASAFFEGGSLGHTRWRASRRFVVADCGLAYWRFGSERSSFELLRGSGALSRRFS